MKNGVITTGGDVAISSQALTECLKTTYQFSGRLIQNICDGSQYFVPNGFWDYVLMLSVLGVVMTMASVLVGILCRVIFE